jgi:hypothetical protein
MQKVTLVVTQEGDVFHAKAQGWPAHGKGSSFKEAIGEWVYFNANNREMAFTITGPVFDPNYTADAHQAT